MEKPFSTACEKNSRVIASELSRIFINTQSVLEIGSGTGQHAAYFSRRLKHLTWQTSDVLDNHAGINAWVNDTPLNNLLAPIVFDVTQKQELDKKYDAIFMSNTLHIMPWAVVAQCIAKVSQALKSNGLLVVYGPFNYDGKFTSKSNENFDQWLKEVDPKQGIRDFEQVNNEAIKYNLTLIEDNAMPANNRLLVWQSGA